MAAPRRRLDVELLRRGLVASREQARRLVTAGKVTVGGAVAERPARLVRPGEAVEIVPDAARYVSRGGEKLHAALDTFAVNPTGLRCCDVGASTGGFTDCLLQHGATAVTALDVGYAQLHERLAADPRVVLVERTDVRHATPAELGAPFGLVTADLSFISLTSVMEHLVALADNAAPLLLLVKPQFEAGRRAAARGRGVIRDPHLWEQALQRVLSAAETAGAPALAATPSPLRGAAGNVEFFLHLRRGATAAALDPAAIVAPVRGA